MESFLEFQKCEFGMKRVNSRNKVNLKTLISTNNEYLNKDETNDELSKKYTKIAPRESCLPALMKIKNSRLFKEYDKIMAPLQAHKKLNRNISEFLNSSYIKYNTKRSTSVCRDAASVSYPRSLTPLNITSKVKPSGQVLYLNMQNIYDKNTLKAKIEHKLKSMLHTSQAMSVKPTREYYEA